MIAPGRLAAYDVLRAVNTGRADLPSALAGRRERLADPRDRALAAELATGTLRRRATLDHLIAHYAHRPIATLDPEVTDILRLGVYQLLYLDRVPASAVVDDAVDLARHAGKRSATGFVNAVMRAVSRARRALPLPARPEIPDRPPEGSADSEAALAYLSITHSHPRWLAARWLARYGFAATEAWVRFNNQPAPLTLRVNTLKVSTADLLHRLAADGVTAEPARYAPDAVIVTAGNPLTAPLAGGGLFMPQDEASQLVGLFASPSPGQRVLDACASPGGKTIVMAGAMGDRGLIVASDRRWRRIDLLRRTLRTAGVGCARVVQLDLLAPLPFHRPFDRVLLDAPCSGLGTIRRDPEIRWRRTASDLVAFAARQLTMLRQAAEGVAPGGLLTYATCSSEPEENEEVIDRFLAGRADFRPYLPGSRGALPAGVSRLLDERGHFRTRPDRDGLEAFFAATLARTA